MWSNFQGIFQHKVPSFKYRFTDIRLRNNLVWKVLWFFYVNYARYVNKQIWQTACLEGPNIRFHFTKPFWPNYWSCSIFLVLLIGDGAIIWVDPTSCKIGSFFLRSLALSVPIRRNFQSNGVKWRSIKLWKQKFHIIGY